MYDASHSQRNLLTGRADSTFKNVDHTYEVGAKRFTFEVSKKETKLKDQEKNSQKNKIPLQIEIRSNDGVQEERSSRTGSYVSDVGLSFSP